LGTTEDAYAGVTASPVPFPAACWLMLSGIGVLGAVVRRRKTAVLLQYCC
jgi:hypothetical protein